MLGPHPTGMAVPIRKFVASFIDPLIAFVSAHAWLAYLTLFLAALLEAVPIVGSVIPGSTIILALSALVPGGELRLEWRARGCGRRRPDWRWFGLLDRTSRATRNPQCLADGQLSGRGSAERGVLSSLGRAGGVLCPLCAADSCLRSDYGGRVGMPPLRFYPVNAAAILLWAPAHVLPGVLAVSALEQYGGWLGIRAPPNITGCRWSSAAR